jgi:hypothetical protein
MNLLTTKQISGLFNISQVMVWHLIQQEKLNALRINARCWLIYQDHKFNKMRQHYERKQT